jgi:alginate O-acetyltransferase complex protein AlgI
MAIGLGKMFGFHFLENFNYPYISDSITEFWRRWHISLSSWFKDYVYIPLGGNRKGEFRTGMNKLAVFFLCGLWHGANWTFVVWGLFHGAFSFLEEAVPSLRKMPKWLGHLYTMLVVCIGFVIFRADTIGEALVMIGKMFAGWDLSAAPVSFALQQCTPYFLCMLVMAVVLCAPAEKAVKRARIGAEAEGSRKETMVQMALYAASFVVLAWCIIRLSGGSYNPFIYFRF